MDFNLFLYYGQVSEADELQADLLQGILQDKQTLFYNRGFGAGIAEYENMPDGVAFQVGLRYSIAAWVAKRNAEVSDGSGGTRDRRAITSQGMIEIDGSKEEKNVRVLYVALADIQKPKTLTASLGI